VAKAITIQSWCDACLEEGRETPGDTLDVPAMLGAPAFVVELCADHSAPFAQMREELERLGRPPEKTTVRTPAPTTQTAGPYVCPACGQGTRPIASGYRVLSG
jgi:hypothetical protein